VTAALARRERRAFRWLLVAALAFVTWQALNPAPPLQPQVSDKLLHVGAFLGLAWLADFGWPDADYWLPKALPLLAYGAIIELAQSGISARSAEWGDLAADAAGLVVYALLTPALRRLPYLARRWSG
jgi:VanZ family protein